MKKIALSLFIVASSLLSFANHITGGKMYYKYLGKNTAGDYKYMVTLNLYRDCYSTGAPLDDDAAIAIFDNSSGARITYFTQPRTKVEVLLLDDPDPCITNPPQICYQVGYYEFPVTLKGSAGGYTITYQRCCRVAGINNVSGSSNIGATYVAIIPGTSILPTAPENNSARFTGEDKVIVCANNVFTYSFAATDDDGDNLMYAFCNAYKGGGPGQGNGFNQATPNPAAGPPYQSVPYRSGFSGNAPLGSTVTINPVTGLISGIAPGEGIYCVTVCATEFRNGVAIATQRKDLQIKIADCSLAAALLKPEYISCDGFTVSYKNLSNSPLINSYSWDFGVPGTDSDTSNIEQPSFTYSDTGVYLLKLVTNRGQPCTDSAVSKVKVFPGFDPGFISSGICITNPTLFKDNTQTKYGIVDSWHWDFGENGLSNDTSTQQNPTYTYPGSGTKNVMLIVTNSKGCIDTAFQDVPVIDKPTISLLPKDTLICIPDSVQLKVLSSGTFSWSPLLHIIGENTATPTVSPTSSTWYYVDVNDQGCKNRDSVRVNVVDHVTLKALGDSTICLGDPAQLNAATDALHFEWSPAAYLDNAGIVNPVATPVAPFTSFQVIGRIGSCSATGEVTVKAVPYPTAKAGPDVTICYNASTQLKGSYIGAGFSWSPSYTLSDPNSMSPVASPFSTTSYVLSVYDHAGCPKAGLDTVLVTVLPKVVAHAGRDTSVVVGQPLQFNGSGGLYYKWSPPTGLSETDIPNPSAVYDAAADNLRYRLIVSDAAGCLDSAFIQVKVFSTQPQVFVPTAFTPNGDGLNDVLKPIAVGISHIDYFQVYNRWGELVFSTTTNGKGWDGSINGLPQGTNTYAWIVHALDYTGKPFFKKGTVTLIR